MPRRIKTKKQLIDCLKENPARRFVESIIPGDDSFFVVEERLQKSRFGGYLEEFHEIAHVVNGSDAVSLIDEMFNAFYRPMGRFVLTMSERVRRDDELPLRFGPYCSTLSLPEHPIHHTSRNWKQRWIS